MNKSPRHLILGLVIVLLAACSVSFAADTLPRLHISDNGRMFVKDDGSGFFYLGDTEWGLFHLTREDVDVYLKDRAAKKFTVIQAVAAFWGGLGTPNAYGQTVFVNNDPAHPNEAYFQHVDYVVDKAASLGLYVAIVPIWSKEYVQQDPSVLRNLGADQSIITAIRAQSPSVVDKASAASYGKFLGARYKDKPVIWILGGDWFADGVEDIWRSMAAGLAEGDGGNHLKTYHPKSPRSSSQWFQADDWLNFNMIQSGHTTMNRNYDIVAADYQKTPTKPVVDGEGGYEGIVDAMVSGGKIQPQDVRRIAYCAVFAGAAGYTYGANGLFGATDRAPARPAATQPAAPWQQALQLPAGAQMQHLRALIESRPMLLRIPDQWLIVNDPMGTTSRIQACRASDGSYALIYTAAGSKLTVRLVDRIYEKVSGQTIKAYWYDPRQGTATVIGSLAKKTTMEFTPPTSGSGNDWVLVLDDQSKNFPPPGRQGP
jgi:hypothetical protein